MNGAVLPDIYNHLKLLVMILVNCFTYSGIMYFAGVFVKSAGAWSGFSTLIGTLIGFLGGIYIPVGELPESVQTILKYFPVIHGCSMFRNTLTEKIGDKIFVKEYYNHMGITIKFNNININWQIQLAILMIFGILFILMSSAIISKRYKSEK